MSGKYPKKITTAWITKELEAGKFPSIYPDKDFLLKHYKLVDEYRTEIKLYKGNCYRELNTYYKTGEVIMQGGCGAFELNQVAKKAGKTGLSPKEKVELVAKRLEELYDKVEPLPYDIVVYRGIKRGTVGQNLFTGVCIKSRLYDLDMHRFCEDADLEETKLWENYKKGDDPRPYVYETLGFVSTTTKIGTALGFADKSGEYDTIMALRLPAGSKFIMPVDANGYDYEYEFILFPQHNSYIINNTVEAKVSEYSSKKIPVYVGSYCESMEKFRPKGGPKLRELRVKVLAPGDWYKKQQQERPLLSVKTSACPYDESCENYLHFCDPESGKCLGDKAESAKKIQNWWRKNNIKGKCTTKKVNECVDKFEACNPTTGKCITTKDVDYNNNYSDHVKKQVLNWVAPETIIAEQKPRYNCTSDKIKQCAEKSKLCNPFSNDTCTDYTENRLWYYNNALKNSELHELVPTGQCKEVKIKDCANWGEHFCDPDTGSCKEINKQNQKAWNKMLAGQTDEVKAEWKKKKAEEEEKKKKAVEEKKQIIISNQEPRYRCTTKKIEKCAEQGKLCHPVHKYQDCKESYENQFDEDLYYVNNVVDKDDLQNMKPYGKCNKEKIEQCANWKEFCDPNTGICLEVNTTNKAQVDAFHKVLEHQKKALKPLMSDYLKMKLPELKEELKTRGLKTSGNKAELIARLAADDAANAPVDYSTMKITELQAELKSRGLKTSGNKAELIARLVADDSVSKQTLVEHTKDDKNTVVQKVKQYLTKINEAPDKNDRLKYAKEVFDYLVINSWFLYVDNPSNKNFSKVVKAKLDEFLNDPDPAISNAFKEYKHLF